MLYLPLGLARWLVLGLETVDHIHDLGSRMVPESEQVNVGHVVSGKKKISYSLHLSHNEVSHDILIVM